MLRLVVVSFLCVSSCVSRPFNGTTNSTSANLWGIFDHFSNLDFDNLEKFVPSSVKKFVFVNKEDGKFLYEKYVPENVKKFAYDTYEDGKDIVYDLYTDIHEEIVNKTQSNVDDFSNFIENLVSEVEEIQAEEHKLFLQEESQSQEQIERRNKEVAENKMKLRELADNIKEQMNRDEESKEPLERAIQQFITYCRSIISSQFYSTEYIWSKVRQAEGTSYRALELVARNANTLKTLVKDLFQKLSTIDISIPGSLRKEGQNVPRSNEN